MATECELMAWIVDKTIIPLYIDTAKSFATLSSGALGLTIVFYEKIVGAKPGSAVNRMMVTSWLFYLLTIASSASYQYFAVRFLDSISCSPGRRIEYLQVFIDSPGLIYGAMMCFFLLASTFLVVAAWRQLPTRNAE
jgi:hypothetical protein